MYGITSQPPWLSVRLNYAPTVLAGAVLASPATRWIADQLNHQPSLCPLLRLTGIACPSCGGTRAGVYLASGDPLTALKMNAGVTVGLVVAGIVMLHKLGVANRADGVAD